MICRSATVDHCSQSLPRTFRLDSQPSPSPSFAQSLQNRITFFSLNPMNPSLMLIRQDSLGTELNSSQGIQKDVHLAAKNLPFLMEVGSSMDLRQLRLMVSLVYDSPSMDFQPVVVKAEPLTHKIFVSQTGSGNRATIEARIQVLTSQHEDSLFRVKVSVHDPVSPVVWDLFSDPIRVLSKPSQVEKYKAKLTQAPIIKPRARALSPPKSSPPTSPDQPKTPDNLVLEALARLEEQQRQQQRTIDLLLIRQPVAVPDPAQSNFEAAFHQLLHAFSQIPKDERSPKVRRLLTTETDCPVRREFVDTFGHELRSLSPSQEDPWTNLCSEFPEFLS
eukprot:TRINITY_DN2465_c0_g1_i1.p1 TRINITY_DN2465_c0_g1~~TRINITY_DN2465_c0_g1_i1.p1  ORF type:complete len:333 (+),score=41.92 TRINITY_DN2465_c0_g1_i1:58-1056(+)